MNPPTPVTDLKANFPQGIYQLAADTSGGSIDRKDWYFVVADHRCYASDILGFPHESKVSKRDPK